MCFLVCYKKEASVYAAKRIIQQAYRLEIRGNTITLLLDSAPVVHVSDATYLQCGPQIGL